MSDSPTLKPETVSIEVARRASPVTREPDALARQELEYNHAQATQRSEQGWIGKFLGSKAEKPGNVAFIVIIICFVIIATAANKMDLKTEFESFMKLTSALFAIITGALGYLFGSNSSSNGK